MRLSEIAKRDPFRFAVWLELHDLDANGEHIYDRDTGKRKSDGVDVTEVVRQKMSAEALHISRFEKGQCVRCGEAEPQFKYWFGRLCGKCKATPRAQ